MELSAEDQAYWKRRLRDEERRLSRRFMSEEDTLHDEQDRTPNQPWDAAEMAEREATSDFIHNLEEGQRREFQAIRDAWYRIDHGEFGKCGNCGEDIDPKRLEAIPYTNYCIKCEESAQ